MWEVKFHPSHPDNLFTCSEDGSIWHWDGSNITTAGTGFPASGKIMETWKMKKPFSRPGKIMEFGKSRKNLEKSWNVENQPGKIMEFCQWFETLWIQFITRYVRISSILNTCLCTFYCCIMIVTKFLSILWLLINWIMWCFTIYSYSYLFGTCTLEKRTYFWNNHGKIMEFDSEIRLETLRYHVLLFPTYVPLTCRGNYEIEIVLVKLIIQ